MARSLATLLSVLAAMPALAAGQDPLHQVSAFGDSFTNNDLFGELGAGKTMLYGMDPIGAAFAKIGPSSGRLQTYAVPGALVTEIRPQMVTYAWNVVLGQTLPATFLSYEAGTNDLIASAGVLERNGPGPATNPITDAILGRQLEDLALLAEYHPRALILVWTLPDLPSLPLYHGLSAAAQQNLRANIGRINAALQRLQVFPNVLVWDFGRAVRQLAASPPVVRGRALLAPPAYGQPDALFADPVHPTAVMNGLLANDLMAALGARFGLSVARYTSSELAALAQR